MTLTVTRHTWVPGYDGRHLQSTRLRPLRRSPSPYLDLREAGRVADPRAGGDRRNPCSTPFPAGDGRGPEGGRPDARRPAGRTIRSGGPGRPGLPSFMAWSVSGTVIKNNIFTASRFFRHACVGHVAPLGRTLPGTELGEQLLPADAVGRAEQVEHLQHLESLFVIPHPAVLTGHPDEQPPRQRPPLLELVSSVQGFLPAPRTAASPPCAHPAVAPPDAPPRSLTPFAPTLSGRRSSVCPPKCLASRSYPSAWPLRKVLGGDRRHLAPARPAQLPGHVVLIP